MDDMPDFDAIRDIDVEDVFDADDDCDRMASGLIYFAMLGDQAERQRRAQQGAGGGCCVLVMGGLILSGALLLVVRLAAR